MAAPSAFVLTGFMIDMHVYLQVAVVLHGFMHWNRRPSLGQNKSDDDV